MRLTHSVTAGLDLKMSLLDCVVVPLHEFLQKMYLLVIKHEPIAGDAARKLPVSFEHSTVASRTKGTTLQSCSARGCQANSKCKFESCVMARTAGLRSVSIFHAHAKGTLESLFLCTVLYRGRECVMQGIVDRFPRTTLLIGDGVSG